MQPLPFDVTATPDLKAVDLSFLAQEVGLQGPVLVTERLRAHVEALKGSTLIRQRWLALLGNVRALLRRELALPAPCTVYVPRANNLHASVTIRLAEVDGCLLLELGAPKP